MYQEKMAVELHYNPESIMELVDAPSLVDDVQLQIQEVLTLLVLPVYMTRPALLSSLCYLSLSITTNCGTSLEGAYPAMVRWLSCVRSKILNLTDAWCLSFIDRREAKLVEVLCLR